MIPFNQSYVGSSELKYVEQAIQSRSLAGDGRFGRQCQESLRNSLGVDHVLLTHSATGALEMAALLADLQPDDEVIMPSFTFVSTANAFVLRKARAVFVDIRPDTLNIDEQLIEAAITPRTRAIVPVHYAGVACEMDDISRIAAKHNLLVIEDAAQGIASSYKGKPLGTIGDMGAFSFHGTKNIGCGEGGAFVTRSREFGERAEIIREKGTNRSKFFRGEVDKYSWIETGSSYVPSELNAAFLCAQLEQTLEITSRRMQIWNYYHSAFHELEREGFARRPVVPEGCVHNGHIYYLLLSDGSVRDQFIATLKERGIATTFHYVPLHSVPHAATCSRPGSTMHHTVSVADRLVRLPLWPGVEEHLDLIVSEVIAAATGCARL